MFFEYPDILWLELILVPMVALYVFREFRGSYPSLRLSTSAPWKGSELRLKRYLSHLPFVFRFIATAALILAIARPRSSEDFEKINTEGIDIIFALDISTSMLARDFKPDRISAAKDIAIEFVAQRPNDRMGIVVFAGESFTQCPVTTDRATLINLMKEIETGLIEDGTAIGNGLATAVARLKESKAPSRVIILLTDGVNNRGEISPMMAVEIAKTYGVRVYTIGVGAMGMAPYPVMTPFGVDIQQVKVEIDETLLKEIALQTGGKYFRATDNTKLLEIYGEINKMEKVKTEVDSFPIYKELFMKYAL
ncbi:MAG: VWA domain-containing protein, partial [Bacteroidales bacterium]|nr:VWA domain-containing protein [Bacteroidales bacterium]